MGKPAKSHLLLKAAGITILAFMLSRLLVAPFSASVSSIFSTPEKTDFILSDIYAQIADRRPVRDVSDKVVMVDIGMNGRDEIVELLEIIQMCGPQAIGIDINFEEPHADDSRLLDFAASCSNAIFPLGVGAVRGQEGIYEITDHAFFFDSLKNVRYGVVNMPGKYGRSTIREFPVGFKMDDGSEIPSFVAAVSKIAAPEAYDALMGRGNRVEPIDYASLTLPVMSGEEVYANPERLHGKVVMVGAVNEASDMHATPVSRYMAGLGIHSYALSTILSGRYYREMPQYVDYLVAMALCYLIVCISISSTAKIKGLFLRLIQLALAYLSVRIGYELYVEYRILANFSVSFLMIAFGPFAIDIWNGSVGLYEVVRDRLVNPLRHRRRERETDH